MLWLLFRRFHRISVILILCFRLSIVGLVDADNTELHQRKPLRFPNSLHNSHSNPTLSIEITTAPVINGTNARYIRVRNMGDQNEFVQMSVLDANGNSIPVAPSQFPLAGGSMTEIPFSERVEQSAQERSAASTNQHHFITVQARGKRDSVSRSFAFGDQYDGVGLGYPGGDGGFPFCHDKDVTGTCRYRTDPSECFGWQWTASATILNNQGPHTISSIPEGLLFNPGEHGRVRVYLTVSCCTPIVQFISTDPHFGTGVNSCVVDVRELQTLHPGEIAGIVIAVVFLLVVIIVVVIVCARRRRREKINHVGMLPRVSSREMMSRQ